MQIHIQMQMQSKDSKFLFAISIEKLEIDCWNIYWQQVTQPLSVFQDLTIAPALVTTICSIAIDSALNNV